MRRRFALLIVVGLIVGACGTENAGQGPLQLSAKVVADLKRYLKLPGPAAFYVTEDGECSAYMYCSDGPAGCMGGPNEASMLKACGARCGRPCRVLALGLSVVWQGPISGPETRWDGRMVARWEGHSSPIDGLVRIDSGGINALLELELPGARGSCSGSLVRESTTKGRWSLTCTGGNTADGVAILYGGRRYDGLLGLRGVASDSPHQDDILPGRWSVRGAGTDAHGKSVWFLVEGLDNWIVHPVAYRRGPEVPQEDVDRPTAATPQPATASPGPKPGEVFSDCETCPEMVVVPAGRFVMGAVDGDPDEFPTRVIRIERPFAVGRYEVTFDEWEACVADGACQQLADEGWGRGRRPAINVDWVGAEGYLRWLSAKTGKRYRFLSESEFEYAARAGSAFRYPWGDEIGSAARDAVYLGQTAEVGQLPPNAFGLFDTNGNVWEWVEDCYGPYAPGKVDGSAVLNTCEWRHRAYQRVMRGGFWPGSPESARSANREARPAGDGAGAWRFNGFRIARDLP